MQNLNFDDGVRAIINPYVYVESYEENNMCFKIKPIDYNCDSNGKFDSGLLWMIVDEYSGIAALTYSKLNPLTFSPSLTLKKASFGEMILGKEYLMQVFVRQETKKEYLLEIVVRESITNEIIHIFQHYKKPSKHKF